MKPLIDDEDLKNIINELKRRIKMIKEELKINNIYNCNCIDLMEEMVKNNIQVDAVITDPPYLYLKNQKLDTPFDEKKYFDLVDKILKPDGFIVLFGRGTSFYRWNTILANKGFIFKEEIIWEKERNTSPFGSLMRKHETISLHTKNGKINKVRIPYLEGRKNNIDGIITDVKRLKVVLNNFKELEEVQKYLETQQLDLNRQKVGKYNITSSPCKSASRCVCVAKTMTDGLIESDVIKEQREYYKMVHPTQKPVKLLERLIKIATNENDLILDTFGGSCNIAIACNNTKRNYIITEKDKEFFEKGVENVNNNIRDKI